jgi:ribosomal-protein-alanine N-acetyltransferase
MSAPPRPTPPKLAELDLAIETPRLQLRPFILDDVEDLWPIVSDPVFPVQMSWAAHADRAETRGFIEACAQGIADNTDVVWAIVKAGKVIGAVGLHGIHWQYRAWRLDRAELGYWLAPTYWNKGLMTEVAHHVLLFAFDALALHKVTVGCLADNIGSRRVIEKLGCRLIGRREEDVWRDGAWHAQLRYELTANQWSDVSTTMPISRPARP